MPYRTHKNPIRHVRTRLGIAALAAFAAFVCIYGFGPSRGSGAIGFAAGNKVITSCGSGMTFSYTTVFDAAHSNYAVGGIELSHIPAGCQSHRLSATFYDSSGAPIGSAVDATLAATGTTQTIALTPGSNTIDVSNVSGISVVVS
jgi:hypothetical protein